MKRPWVFFTVLIAVLTINLEQEHVAAASIGESDHDFGLEERYWMDPGMPIEEDAIANSLEDFPARNLRRHLRRKRSKRLAAADNSKRPGCCQCGDHLCCDSMCHGK